MPATLAPPSPKSVVTVVVEPVLRARLAEFAAGRPLVLDYVTSRRCGVVVGDLTASFRRTAPGIGYVELAAVDGVRLFAREPLLRLITDAALTIRAGLMGAARSLHVELAPASRWIDFLDGRLTPGEERIAS